MSIHQHGLESGHVQVYTGEGKGKTTAALGLVLRAAGAGLSVFMAHFAKGSPTSEHVALERLGDLVTWRHYGTGRLIRGKPGAEDLAAARRGLEEVREALGSGCYQVVVLDEANVATRLGLFPVEALLELIDARPEGVELIITGRGADPRVMERADLVTEMRQVKHYFAQGIRARRGIEE